ncbi:MAG TPA: exodeoxyribonuclease VII large subunit [Bacteroidaceae bacterium]|nr:exodeoxyribonuclease VII large subunit [Bacteroidaceae bacterium]
MIDAQTDAWSLETLGQHIQDVLLHGMPHNYWVQAEIARVSQSRGHCYLELVQQDVRSGYTVAKMRANIWASTYAQLAPKFIQGTGQHLSAGQQVLLFVRVTFHPLYGASLQVVDIDPTYTLGEQARKRMLILKQLREEGVDDMNKSLPLPSPIQKVAIISSSTAAGYGDFCNQLHKNSQGYIFYTHLYEASMQGQHTETSILSALDAILDSGINYDVVVIIRGGGATSDLQDFDTYMLAAAVAQFPVPILVGIGHERDTTVLDEVACISLKTPTAVASYLLDKMEELHTQLLNIETSIQQIVRDRLDDEKHRLQDLQHRIPLLVKRRMDQEKSTIQQYQQFVLVHVPQRIRQEHQRLLHVEMQVKNAPIMSMQRKKNQLDFIEQQLHSIVVNVLKNRHDYLDRLAQRVYDCSPDRILEKGYSMTFVGGKLLKSYTDVSAGDLLVTRLHKGEVRSVVQDEDNA